MRLFRKVIGVSAQSTLAKAALSSGIRAMQGSRTRPGNDVPPPHWLIRVVTSLLLFALLREWLLPLAYVAMWTDLTRVDVIIGSVGFALACGCVVLSWRRLPLVLAAGLALAVPWLYYGLGEVGSWAPRLESVLLGDVRTVMGGGVILSPELRTLLLLTGCMALACALQSLMWLRLRAGELTLATALLVLSLQWWFGIPALLPLLHVIAFGGLLAVVLTCSRVSRTAVSELLRSERRWQSGGLAAGALLVAALLAGGWWAAADRPAPDGPAPWAIRWQERGEEWLRAQREAAGARYAARPAGASPTAQPALGQVGYGDDDSQLGMPLTAGESIVFTAYTTAPVSYWRGEAKTFYSGQGWLASPAERLDMPLDAPFGAERADTAERDEHARDSVSASVHPVSTTGSGEAEAAPALAAGRAEAVSTEGVADTAPAYTEPVRVRLAYADRQADLPLFTPGGESRVLQLASDSEALHSYRRDVTTDSLYPGSEPTTVMLAELESRRPLLALDHGRAATDGDGEADESEEADAADTASARAKVRSIIEDALQLPDGITERTIELAREVTASAGSDPRAQAAALERYLQSRYRYTLADTARPPGDADFVDHFLFEQQAGYCVHFSSAMVVMLRTLDIPARWVKGFAAPTQPLGELSSGPSTELAEPTKMSGELAAYRYRADVRQRDAHAWVEVYIAGSGWVAYDPTPSAGVRAASAAADTAVVARDRGDGADGSGTAKAGFFDGKGWSERIRSWYEQAAHLGVWTLERTAGGIRQASELMQPVLARTEQMIADIGAGSMRSAGVAALGLIGGLALASAAAIGWRRRGQLALAWALRGYERSCGLGRPTRRRLLAVIGRSMRQIERAHGVRLPSWSGREYASSLALQPAAASALLTLIRWEEEARFSAAHWHPPAPAELRTVAVELRIARSAGGRSDSSPLVSRLPALRGLAVLLRRKRELDR
ncbi:hypothetical protein PA598K_04044 [Paenibacillus sp. 598K]|uniref:transglutaminase-like domain-containing protein n=1 Tax=Paenibacillus sp. 598K TaxID=1117987 RepID=UPI000FF98505|nr:transglutaminase-like domain-containing protein [Paenibacillus sp. 598K]GBF75625.1 hypothetical protein PA598K_04044 [Paenibacillus sp. 598K]